MAEVTHDILDLLQKSTKILVIPSSPPDGDSIGSALALFKTLQKLGKNVTVVCAEPVPGTLQFLPEAKMILEELKGSNDFVVTLDCSDAEVDKLKYEIVDNKVNIIITPKKGNFSEKHVSFKTLGPDFDLVITVDTADVKQLGHIYEGNTDFFYRVPVINIDHHISNLNFGKINYVDTAASSTTEILYGLLRKLETATGMLLIDNITATYLLTGIITDTGSFQNANTTPRSLEVSADLVERGAAQQDIIKHVFRTKNLSTLKLWGEVLSKIQTDEEYKIVWSTMTKADLLKSRATPEEISGIIDDLLTNAPGAEVVFILKEMDSQIAASLRSTTSAVNVSAIAERFGGGGHVQAAGFKVSDRMLPQVEKELLEAIRQYQRNRMNGDQHAAPAPREKVPATPAQETAKPEPTPIISQLNKNLLGIKPAETVIQQPKQQAQPAQQQPHQARMTQAQSQPVQHQQSTGPAQQYPQPMASDARPQEADRKRKRRRRKKKLHPPLQQPKPPTASTPPSQAAAPVQEQVQPAQEQKPAQPQSEQQQVQAAPQATRIAAPPVAPVTPASEPGTPAPTVSKSPQAAAEPATPAAQSAPPAQPAPEKKPVQPTPPAPEKPAEPPKKTFDPFNPPDPSESDILAALSKL